MSDGPDEVVLGDFVLRLDGTVLEVLASAGLSSRCARFERARAVRQRLG